MRKFAQTWMGLFGIALMCSFVAWWPAAAQNSSPQGSKGKSNSKPAVATEASPEKSSKPKKYEPLFQDWPDPEFVFVFSGQQIGYIEPCGCAGLAEQKGGLARRHSLVTQLKGRGWTTIPLDVGNQVRRSGRQAEIQFERTAEALKTIGYKAIAFGGEDLRLSSGELAAFTAGMDSLFVSANTAVINRELTPEFHVIEAGTRKIGVTSVVGQTYLNDKVTSQEIPKSDPVASLKGVIPKMKSAGCNMLVLLAHATMDESKDYAKRFPEFQIVVTAGGIGEPPYRPEEVKGARNNPLFIEVGAKAQYVIVVGVYKDSKTPYRYQRVPLDDRFPDSKEMLESLATYQDQLKISGLEGLGLKPLRHPTGRQFAGSQECGNCHTKAMAVFQDTTHATATDTLVSPPERKQIARHFDPECLSCHVTGWNPQKHQPYLSGYLSLKDTPLMVGNGCENCHGPGAAHVEAENQDSADKLMRRREMKLTMKAAEQKCLECHDIDNSPSFQKPGAFDLYWKKVAHKGVD